MMMAVSTHAPTPVRDELEAWLKELGLCDSFKLAGTLMLTPEAREVTEEIKAWVKTLGVKKAFKLNGTLMLYSGPRPSIFNLFITKYKKNHARAFSIIKSGTHSILDRTITGRRLEKYKGLKRGVFEHFANTFVKEKKDPAIIQKQKIFAQRQIDITMGFASAALIFAAEGDVETVVSGASLEKVFVLFELPALMANPKIKKINGVAIEEFRKIYISGDKDAVYQTFQKVCESEVALLLERAEASGLRKNARPWRRYQAQNDLWQAEKKETLTLAIA